MAEIIVNGLAVQWQRKQVKNLNLSVRAGDGRVRVSVPMHVSAAAVRRLVIARRPWIDRHRERIFAQAPTPDWQYLDGELHPYLGSDYRLCVIARAGRPTVTLEADRICLHIGAGSTALARRALLIAWYRQQIKAALLALLSQWQPIIGEPLNEWRVKQMKTRWGSCNINARRIWLNLELIKKTPDCLEYVVVHELLHLLERYHNARFYRFMDQFLPNWRETRARLNAGGMLDC